jgi:membrane-associated phospholipid phosphatase
MAVSLLRKLIKRPRPYEKAGAGIDPLIKKDAEGNSMPSRHLASAAVLSLIFFPECIWLGIVALVATELLSLLRFLQGAHYPTDLLVGELLGFAFGAIGFLF